MIYGTGMLGLQHLPVKFPLPPSPVVTSSISPSCAVLLALVLIAEHPISAHWHRIRVIKWSLLFAARLAYSMCHTLVKHTVVKSWICSWKGLRSGRAEAGEEAGLSGQAQEAMSWSAIKGMQHRSPLLAAGKPCPASAACRSLAWRGAVSPWTTARETGGLPGPSRKQRPFPAVVSDGINSFSWWSGTSPKFSLRLCNYLK